MEDTTVRKYDFIRCSYADDETKFTSITVKQANSLLGRTGGNREKKMIVSYMEVDLTEEGNRANIISCFWYDGSHIADIAYRADRGWYIVG